MTVLRHAAIEKLSLPGIDHQTLAGPRDGLRTLEVWMQTVAPGAETPWHRHDCEEVVVVLQGSGTYDAEGRSTTFGPGSTVIIPANVPHRLVNSGSEQLCLVAALGMAPVTVETAAGARLELPWDQHRFAHA